MISIASRYNLLQTLLLDIAFTLVVLFVPTLSHLTGFPFYIFEPMRLIIIPYLVFTKNKNAYFLALALPLFSYVFAGHPALFKMPLVAIDLFVNVALLYFFIGKKLNIYLSLALSIIISKVVYYSLKAIFVYFGLLANGLIETPLLYQSFNIIILLIVLLVYILVKKKKDFNLNK